MTKHEKDPSADAESKPVREMPMAIQQYGFPADSL